MYSFNELARLIITSDLSLSRQRDNPATILYTERIQNRRRHTIDGMRRMHKQTHVICSTSLVVVCILHPTPQIIAAGPFHPSCYRAYRQIAPGISWESYEVMTEADDFPTPVITVLRPCPPEFVPKVLGNLARVHIDIIPKI